jgi:hypothetical protein
MADNTPFLRIGRPDGPYYNNQLDAVTESDGLGGYRLKTTGGGGGGGDATAANQLVQINIEGEIRDKVDEANANLVDIKTNTALAEGYLLNLNSWNYPTSAGGVLTCTTGLKSIMFSNVPVGATVPVSGFAVAVTNSAFVPQAAGPTTWTASGRTSMSLACAISAIRGFVDFNSVPQASMITEIEEAIPFSVTNTGAAPLQIIWLKI